VRFKSREEYRVSRLLGTLSVHDGKILSKRHAGRKISFKEISFSRFEFFARYLSSVARKRARETIAREKERLLDLDRREFVVCREGFFPSRMQTCEPNKRVKIKQERIDISKENPSTRSLVLSRHVRITSLLLDYNRERERERERERKRERQNRIEGGIAFLRAHIRVT